jgi:diaminopropionate ammonia-lyase
MASRVMQGYATLTAEIIDQLGPEARPTHVFLQAGVGGLAAAVAGPLWEAWGAARPRVIIVEPESADCVYRSIAAGALTSVPGDLGTFMACLAAGEMSTAAWTVLKGCADDVLALEDEAARHAMRRLAAATPSVVAGESGGVGIAGLIAAVADEGLGATLGIDREARVLCINSEGDTDPQAWAATVEVS